MLTAQAWLVTYGERFHELRLRLWSGKRNGKRKTVLGLAERLDSKYPTTIYNIERQWRVPALPTLLKHARALGCQPWDLLTNVETEYDLVRRLTSLRPDEADREWQILLKRYKKSATRQKKTPSHETMAKRFDNPHGNGSALQSAT